jgi:hypothetical protein
LISVVGLLKNSFALFSQAYVLYLVDYFQKCGEKIFAENDLCNGKLSEGSDEPDEGEGKVGKVNENGSSQGSRVEFVR